MDNTSVLLRSNNALTASNVHFIVHHNAKLVVSAKRAIMMDRDEVCTTVVQYEYSSRVPGISSIVRF